MLNIKKFFLAIGLVPKEETDSRITEQGELEVLNTDGKLRYHNGTSASPVVTESHAATLTNKIIDANGDGNSISNIETADLASSAFNTSSTLSGASDTQIPSALAVKSYADSVSGTVAGDLTTHINDTTNAHAASAIGNTPSGNLEATDVQAALNELQTDVDTRATSAALTAHTGATTGAHAASAISVTPTGNLDSINVQNALVELQTDIDGKVTGPVSSTDDALARFNFTTGKFIKNSSALLTDSGILTGLTDIQIDDTAPTGNKLLYSKTGITDRNNNKGLLFTKTAGNTDLNLSARFLLLTGTTVIPTTTDSTSTGSNAGINSFGSSHIILTNSSLISIASIVGSSNGSLLILTNNTGNDVELLNNGPFSPQILTGTESDITFRNQSSLFLTYNNSIGKWIVVGGTGGATSSVKLIAGEALSANDCVYQSKVDGKVYKASSNSDDKVDVLGFARKAALVDASVEVITGGILKGFTGLEAGKIYYLEIDGGITASPVFFEGTWKVPVALAVSSTDIAINPAAASLKTYNGYYVDILNNISAASNVTGLAFDGAVTRSFTIDYSIYRETSTNAKAQVGQLRGVYNTKNNAWFLSDDYAGENAEIEFSIDSTGQVQYKSSNLAGTGHTCALKYTIRKTFTA
jgi:5-hydroxyisourate hydrolase-like protein (transthyretin family)